MPDRIAFFAVVLLCLASVSVQAKPPFNLVDLISSTSSCIDRNGDATWNIKICGDKIDGRVGQAGGEVKNAAWASALSQRDSASGWCSIREGELTNVYPTTMNSANPPNGNFFQLAGCGGNSVGAGAQQTWTWKCCANVRCTVINESCEQTQQPSEDYLSTTDEQTATGTSAP